MPDSQNPDHVRLLIQEFQLKGINLVPTVTGEIAPVVLIADLTKQDPEGGWAQGGVSVSPAVGFIPQAAIENPANSGVILEVNQFAVSSATAADLFRFGLVVAGTLASTGLGQWLNTGRSGNPVGAITSANNDATPDLTIPGRINVLADQSITIRDVRATLTPGNGFMVEGSTTANAGTFYFQWFERAIRPGEAL